MVRHLSYVSGLPDQATKYLSNKDVQITLNLHQISKGQLPLHRLIISVTNNSNNAYDAQSYLVHDVLKQPRQKAAKRGTQHWACNVPALQTWMESASTSSGLISEVSSLADSDIRDVDLDSVNVKAHSHFVEASVHQGPVDATSALVESGQAPTMDNLVSAQQCTTLLMCTHAPPLSSTFSALLLEHPTSVAGPLLVSGPSFLPGTRPPISMLPSAPLVFSGCAIQRHVLCICLVTCLSPRYSRSPCKLSLKSLPGNARIWRPESLRSKE